MGWLFFGNCLHSLFTQRKPVSQKIVPFLLCMKNNRNNIMYETKGISMKYKNYGIGSCGGNELYTFRNTFTAIAQTVC